MPDIRNCRKCGKIYNYIGGMPICPLCRQKDEEDYQRVKEYLYQYPGATLSEVSTELGVAVETIKRYLRDGRLEIIGEDGNLFLECESCGKAIRSGRFCDECERDISRELKSTAGQLGQSLSKAELERRAGIRYLSKEDTKEKKDN